MTAPAPRSAAAFLGRFRGLGRTAGIYVVGNAINAAVPILLLPVLTRRLSVDEYGILGMYDLLVGLVLPVVGLSLQGAIARQYYERDRVDLPRYIGTCLNITAATVVVAMAGLYLFQPLITRYTGLPGAWLGWVVLGALGQFLSLVVLAVWQVRQEPVRFGMFRISQTMVNIALSLVLVIPIGLGWRGRVVGQAVSFAVFGIGGIIWLWRSGWIKFGWDRAYATNALHFGLPLIPHTIGFWAVMMIDRLFVSAMLGPADVGRYTAGYQIGMGISLLQNSFNQAWTPWFYERLKADAPEEKRAIVRFTYGYMALMLAMAAGLALLAPLLGRTILGKAFHESIGIVGWIGLGYAFNGMYKMVTNYIFYAQRTWLLAWVTAMTAVAGAGINYVLIRWNGLQGAAQASCLTFALSFLGTWWMAHRVHPMPWFGGAGR